jgi:hypothetical protein
MLTMMPEMTTRKAATITPIIHPVNFPPSLSDNFSEGEKNRFHYNLVKATRRHFIFMSIPPLSQQPQSQVSLFPVETEFHEILLSDKIHEIL